MAVTIDLPDPGAHMVFERHSQQARLAYSATSFVLCQGGGWSFDYVVGLYFTACIIAKNIRLFLQGLVLVVAHSQHCHPTHMLRSGAEHVS